MINKPLSPRNVFLILFAFIFILITLACGGSSAPSGTGAQPEATFPASAQTQLVSATKEPEPIEIAAPAAIPETRRLTLEYPPKMRAGVEADIVRLTLEVDDLGNITPTAQTAGNVINGQTIQIPNLYDTHNVAAEAQLDLAGMQVKPADAVFESLTPGQTVTFYWSIRPQDPGVYHGTVWLHLNFTDKSTGEQSRIAVSAQIIEIEAVDFFGLSVNTARTSGVIGSVVGGVIGFPFLEDIVKFIFKRKKK